MEAAISQSKRRMWVIINYGALAALVGFFYVGRLSSLSTGIMVGGGLAILLVLISFVKLYAQTRLWRFVHTKVDNLDERQLGVTYESLRHSYSVFTVICLVVLLAGELLRDRALGGSEISLMPIVAALIYLAHVLPASVIAWTEREIYRE